MNCLPLTLNALWLPIKMKVSSRIKDLDMQPCTSFSSCLRKIWCVVCKIWGLTKIGVWSLHKKKQTRASFKANSMISRSKALELLDMYLFWPIDPSSMGDKRYCLAIMDDYTRYTSVYFLTKKSKTFKEFTSFCKKCKMKKVQTLLS